MNKYKKMPYDEYLKTTRWEVLAFGCKDRDKKCKTCTNTTKLNAHHISYDNLGTAKEADDLITLCKDCHERIHCKGKYKLQPKEEKSAFVTLNISRLYIPQLIELVDSKMLGIASEADRMKEFNQYDASYLKGQLLDLYAYYQLIYKLKSIN